MAFHMNRRTVCRTICRIWLALSMSVLIGPAQAAGFDCARAAGKIEKMICDDPQLSKQDADLSLMYRETVKQSEDRAATARSQKQWLSEVRGACRDAACLKKAYRDRLEELAVQRAAAGALQTESLQYTVRCDRRSMLLIISESGMMPETEGAGSFKDIAEFTINPDSLTRIGGTEMDPLRLPSGRKTYGCRLGQALYKVVIEPNIQNGRLNGECGAADPDIVLSVRRDSKQIFSNLAFQRCRGESGGRTINRIRLSEASDMVKVLFVPNAFFLPISVEKTFALSSPPADWERAIFEDFPTGDANADLFIAIYKRDIDAVKRALQRGADPNAKDNEGFPPLALLGTGREAAYRDGKLEEFDKLSQSIARIVFAAGATGRAENANHVTLLDHMLSRRVPTPVIEMLLAHGASVQDGYPLGGAAFRADGNLLEKFIGSGADPNKKAANGSTALWTAATTGFYSYGGSDTPPIAQYARCVRLLLQRGARVQDAVSDSMGMPWMLVRSFGKDERLEMILSELIPYASRDDLVRAQQLAEKNAYPIAQWFRRQLPQR